MQHLSFLGFRIQLLTVALFLILLNTAFCAEIEIPLEYDRVWLTTAQVIAMEGFSLSEKSKDLGIIQGIKEVDGNSAYFKCERLRGRAKSHTLKISSTVRKKNETTSLVEVKVEAVRKSYRNRHFLFITIGRVHDETECTSTGQLESLILNKISSGS